MVKSKRASALLRGCRGLLGGVCLLVLLANRPSFAQQNSTPTATHPGTARSPNNNATHPKANPTSSKINAKQQANGAQPDLTLELGEAIFSTRCAICHGEHGEGRSAVVGILGPNIQAEHDAGRVMTAVEVGPSHMPRFEYVLSVEDMHAVSQYVADELAVIPLSGGDVGEGGEWFRMYCAGCHRTAVRGGALGFVGTNAPDLKAKSPALIAGTIRWGPGPMPKFPPSVLTDEQVASIVAYIQTIQHPINPGGDPLQWWGPTSEGFVAWVIVLGMIGITWWIEKGGRG